MIEVKALVGKLNLDDHPSRLPKEDFVDSLNMTLDSIEGSNDLVRANIIGNRIVNYSLPAGTNKVIGSFSFLLRGTIIYFVYNSNGNHSILEFNTSTRAIAKIFESETDSGGTDILGFSSTGQITSINVFPRSEGDLLLFLDTQGRPTIMDIAKFKAGAYTPVTRDIIDLATRPPLTPPQCVYGNDTTRRVNNHRNRLYRFAYRFVYDDFRRSCLSPISELPLPVSILSDVYTSVVTNNNVISVAIETGDKDVRAIELLVSFVERSNDWSDFLLVDTLDKARLSINDNTTFSYQFYNDSVYPPIDPQEAILLFDYVPQAAKAMDMPNGNVVVFGAITEGYDRNLTPNVTNTITTYPAASAASGSLVATMVRRNATLFFWRYELFISGFPAVGTNIIVRLKDSGGSFVTIANYTTIAGDNASTVVSALVPLIEAASGVNVSNFSLFGNWIQFEFSQGSYQDYADAQVTPATTSVGTNSLPVWKWSTERNIGIAYFDNVGRTNGILYNAKVTFPAYAENVSNQVLLPKITTQVFHRPPLWAKSYQFYFTKENTGYLFWATNSVNITETDHVYFEVTGLLANAKKNPTTGTVLSYAFQEGDRLRLLKPLNGSSVVYPDTYDAAILGLVVNPTINGVVQTDKQFLKIKKTAPFTDSSFVQPPSSVPYLLNYLIEIYRPTQQQAGGDKQVYFECGRKYNILDAGTADRRHEGETTNQSADLATPATIEFTKGDAYFRPRVINLSDTGIATFSCVDRNFVDFYISAVNSIDGRPNIIDTNAKREFFPTLVRFGQAYQINTNINGLNRFYPNNFDEYELGYGDIERLKVRDRTMRVFQKYKVGVVPLFNQISKNADGTTLNVVTDKLLNPIQYYAGNFGIGDHPESLASSKFADYFADDVNGAICRVSNDGVVALSIMYKINSWANQEVSLRKAGNLMIGGFDNRLNNYVLSLSQVGGSTAKTIVYDEENNGFEGFVSYIPESMAVLGTLFVTFKNGALWTHDATTYNNFYGVQYSSYITAIFNQSPNQVKTFLGIEYRASSKFFCSDIETSSTSYGSVKQQSDLVEADFVLLEDKYNAALLRDKNSIGGINNGDILKGNHIKVRFDKTNPTTIQTLNFVSLKYNDSPLNNR